MTTPNVIIIDPYGELRIVGQFPIQQFEIVKAEAAAITATFNDLVVNLNQQFIAMGASAGGFVTMKQLRLAMAAQGIIQGFNSSVSANVANTVNILWNYGNTMYVGDPLYAAIQTQTGYTNLQMAALVALALTETP